MKYEYSLLFLVYISNEDCCVVEFDKHTDVCFDEPYFTYKSIVSTVDRSFDDDIYLINKDLGRFLMYITVQQINLIIFKILKVKLKQLKDTLQFQIIVLETFTNAFVKLRF